MNAAGVMFVAGENAAPSAWLVWLQLERLVPARRMKAKATSAVNRRTPHLGARGKAGFAQDVFIEGQYIPRRRRWRGAPNGRLWFRGARHVQGDSGLQFGMRPPRLRTSACGGRGAWVSFTYPKKVLRAVSTFGWGAMRIVCYNRNGTKDVAICKFDTTV